MNWGMKIVVVLAMFMIGIVGAGIYMVRQNSDTLEEGDYYEKGIEYDVQYRQKQNLVDQEAMPTFALNKDSLIISFKKSGNQGVLLLQRPSDRSLDRQELWRTNSDRYAYPLQDITAGLWKIRLQWKQQNMEFYHEQTIHIPAN
jgi:hypothetical protein